MKRSAKEKEFDRERGVRVLKVDTSGTPVEWLSPKDAIAYVAQDNVLWSYGENAVTFRGGIQRLTGQQSILSAPAIMAVKSPENLKTWANHDDVMPLRRELLFRRDRYMCAYCGTAFSSLNLTIEHVKPRSKGGPDAWTNVVTACRACNQKKDDRTPEEAGMPLMYLPYTPNRFEHFLLAMKSNNILGDQMEYLRAKVGADSRAKSNWSPVLEDALSQPILEKPKGPKSGKKKVSKKSGFT
jgi:HNH endonuclease